MAVVFVGIGSNMGERRANLEDSIERLSSEAITLLARSKIYETFPVGFIAETSFLNMVIQVESDLNPSGLLRRFLSIENSMGRVRRGAGFQSRVIDLDILFYNDIIVDYVDLIIPHPQIQYRMFVLEPMCDIAPDFIHPVLGKTMWELKDSIDQ